MGLNDFLYSAGRLLNNPSVDEADQRFRSNAADQNLQGLKQGIQQAAGAFGAGINQEGNPSGFHGQGASGGWDAPTPPPPPGMGMYPNVPIDFTANPLDQIPKKDPTANADGGSGYLSPMLPPEAPDSVRPPLPPGGYVHAKINGKDWVDYTTTASDPRLANTEPSREIVAPPPRDTGGGLSMMQISGNTPGARRLEMESKLQELEQNQMSQELAFSKLTPDQMAQQKAAQRPMDHQMALLQLGMQTFGDQGSYVQRDLAQKEHALGRPFSPQEKATMAAAAAADWEEKMAQFGGVGPKKPI